MTSKSKKKILFEKAKNGPAKSHKNKYKIQIYNKKNLFCKKNAFIFRLIYRKAIISVNIRSNFRALLFGHETCL